GPETQLVVSSLEKKWIVVRLCVDWGHHDEGKSERKKQFRAKAQRRKAFGLFASFFAPLRLCARNLLTFAFLFDIHACTQHSSSKTPPGPRLLHLSVAVS